MSSSWWKHRIELQDTLALKLCNACFYYPKNHVHARAEGRRWRYPGRRREWRIPVSRPCRRLAILSMARLSHWPGAIRSMAQKLAPEQLTSQAERYGLRTKRGKIGGVRVDAVVNPNSRLAAIATIRMLSDLCLSSRERSVSDERLEVPKESSPRSLPTPRICKNDDRLTRQTKRTRVRSYPGHITFSHRAHLAKQANRLHVQHRTDNESHASRDAAAAQIRARPPASTCMQLTGCCGTWTLTCL